MQNCLPSMLQVNCCCTSGFQAFSNHYAGYLAWLNIGSDLLQVAVN